MNRMKGKRNLNKKNKNGIKCQKEFLLSQEGMGIITKNNNGCQREELPKGR